MRYDVVMYIIRARAGIARLVDSVIELFCSDGIIIRFRVVRAKIDRMTLFTCFNFPEHRVIFVTGRVAMNGMSYCIGDVCFTGDIACSCDKM